ncbi:TetR family transcriptional regulator [Streptomyces griseoaurantiacus]|uniref:TetR family transcriptional regulator n=1 Tax=Streptomyces griseoaurantiacus TaxID=68213 RepID=UPI0030E28A04
MVRDSAETQRRLREAAAAEFAERGPDGTTMTRIARRAGVNKERLYAYFGDKDDLFATVVTEALERLSAAAAPDGIDFGDLGEVAGRTFDYYAAHPELARLLLWEGLRADRSTVLRARAEHYRRKVAATRRAQERQAIDPGVDPGYLMFAVIGLVTSWYSLPQVAEMLTGEATVAPAELARRRAFVVATARRIAAPD